MENKGRNVFIIGAGFSASAKLPIQDRILGEMIAPPDKDILSYNPESESIKFLLAYINVGIYLIQNYTSVNGMELTNEFLQSEREFGSNIKSSSALDVRYKNLQIIKEKVRQALYDSKIQISLEDVFTSFDKSYQAKEYFHQYSYHSADDIKEYIVRLFVYYFCKCGKMHSYDNKDYLEFFNFIKGIANVSILSTNWDFLIEEYLDKQKIKYNLCLNEPYYHIKGPSKKVDKSTVNFIKLHGSISWFKCLTCGTINIVKHMECGNFLFDDASVEKCDVCKKECNEGYLMQSQIITPTMMKSINNQLYSNLWSAARRDLRDAERITFIGYSLPMADFELRYLFQQSIPAEIPIDVVLYHDDDPNQTDKDNLKKLLPEKRYRDLFVKNKLTFFYEGFGEYFHNLSKLSMSL